MEATWKIAKLVHAVQLGDFEAVRENIERHGQSPNAVDAEGHSLLHWAALNNRVRIARYLIGRGAVVNATGGKLKETPLQWACRHDAFTFMIRLLVKEGRADIQIKNVHGQDALCIAVQNSSSKIVFLLLQFGANPNERDLNNETPLIWLFKNKLHDSSDIQRLLIRYKADVTAVDSDLNTILHIAAIMGYANADLYSLFRIYELCSRTIHSMKNHQGLTPFQISWKKLDIPMMQFLFDCYSYMHFPYAVPVAIHAFLVFLSFILLQSFGIVMGSILMVFFYLIGDRMSQPTLMWKPRHQHGMAYGIIFSLLGNHLFFVETLVHRHWMILVYGTVLVTLISLYKCSSIIPGHIPRNRSMQLRTKLINGIIIQGNYEGLISNSIDEVYKQDILKYPQRNIFEPRLSIDMKKLSSTAAAAPAPPSPVNALRSRRRSIDMKGSVNDDDAGDDDHNHVKDETEKFLLNKSHKISFDDFDVVGKSAASKDDDDDLEEGSDGDDHHHNQGTYYDDHEPDWGNVTPVKLCTTCMVDRSNANSHCISCDRCMVNLDHHCVFMDNCIGVHNRRWFVLFTLMATAANVSVFLLSFYVQNALYCAEARGIFWNLFAVQSCMLSMVPALALSTYLALFCAVWIGRLFFWQVYLIAVESTTYMHLKQFHNPDSDPKMSANCLRRGLINCATFIYSGHYTVRPKSFVKHQDNSSNNSSSSSSSVLSLTPSSPVRSMGGGLQQGSSPFNV